MNKHEGEGLSFESLEETQSFKNPDVLKQGVTSKAKELIEKDHRFGNVLESSAIIAQKAAEQKRLKKE